MQDATADGKINLILTKDLSRLGRDYIEAGRYTDVLNIRHRNNLEKVRLTAYNDNDEWEEWLILLNAISVKEAAEKWQISERRVQRLCESGRVKGVKRFGHSWMIPADAEKPFDLRRKDQSEGGASHAETD